MIANDRLDKSYEGKSPAELTDAPIDALQGVSAADAARMKEAFGLDNIGEMAKLKFYQRAKAIAAMAKGGNT